MFIPPDLGESQLIPARDAVGSSAEGRNLPFRLTRDLPPFNLGIFGNPGWEVPISRFPDFHPRPGSDIVLKTDVKVQFDRTVTDRSNPLFGLVSTSKHVASFPAFA